MEQSPESSSTLCEVPPEGWLCIRMKGHDGPCAALPDTDSDVLTDRALLEALSNQVAALQVSHDRVLALLQEYGSQIQPTIEALSKSPIMKMLGVKNHA